MKLKILSAIAMMGLATCGFGQGLLLGNSGNTGGTAATSGGQLFNGNLSVFDGNDYDIGCTVLFGAVNSGSAGSLTAYGTYYPGQNAGNPYTGLGNGTFALGALGAQVNPPGATAGGSVWVELQIWDYNSPLSKGTFSTYAAALAAGDPVGTVLFDQTGLSNPGGSPATNPGYLSAMPSIVLVAVPEPATLALVGLGMASLLAFRRRS